MPSITELAQSLVNGVGIGLVYGLIAIGFCVIYNASGIVNSSRKACSSCSAACSRMRC
jgi:branched-subunit amino acid ABC-type transport system permease component